MSMLSGSAKKVGASFRLERFAVLRATAGTQPLVEGVFLTPRV
ncbi:hypothetical protein D4764_15G0008720 [Takifugu flavidus]|uniref:Uncharacterized protein n=1 Tax=Takifugu flavidus TaxID=433684 RepID=A0A5C6P334_9TELE|nr:hypothetical protein D4764_15G0008720 [Takifugu flavidus]